MTELTHSKSNKDTPIETDIARLGIEMAKLRRAERARATMAGYEGDWRMFTRWCAVAGREPLPASSETVCLFVTYRLDQRRKISTVLRHLTSISHFHREAGCAASVEHAMLLLKAAQRVRREQPRQATPLAVRDLRKIRRAMPGTDVLIVRDRAILLFGFASALRRANLTGLDLSDLTWGARGVRVHVRREKQNQTGPGREIGIAAGKSSVTCPIRALKAWLRVRGDAPGALFVPIEHGRPNLKRRVAPKRIPQIVRRAVELIGLEPGTFSGHSLRAGFITEALERGVDGIRVAAHSGHRSLQTLKRYFRPRDPFRVNACAMVGL